VIAAALTQLYMMNADGTIAEIEVPDKGYLIDPSGLTTAKLISLPDGARQLQAITIFMA